MTNVARFCDPIVGEDISAATTEVGVLGESILKLTGATILGCVALVMTVLAWTGRTNDVGPPISYGGGGLPWCTLLETGMIVTNSFAPGAIGTKGRPL